MPFVEATIHYADKTVIQLDCGCALTCPAATASTDWFSRLLDRLGGSIQDGRCRMDCPTILDAQDLQELGVILQEKSR